MRFTGTLLIMDGKPDASGDYFCPDSEVSIKDQIRVVRDFDDNKAVGYATAKKEGDKITFDMELHPHFITEQVARLLRPCVGGKIAKRSGRAVESFSIESIGLSLINADWRIKKLGEE